MIQRTFFSRVFFRAGSCFGTPFHPHVSVSKRYRSFCQKCRWRVNTRAPYLCGYEWNDIVNLCMVELVSRTELSPRRQQFHVAPACNNQTALSVNIKNTRYERLKPLIQNHTRHKRSESAREQRIAIYIYTYIYIYNGVEWSGRLQAAESVRIWDHSRRTAIRFYSHSSRKFSAHPKSSLARIDKRAARAARETRYHYNQIGPLDHKMADQLCFLGPHQQFPLQ